MVHGPLGSRAVGDQLSEITVKPIQYHVIIIIIIIIKKLARE